MSTFRSGYATESSITLPVSGMRQVFSCAPGGEVTVPDEFDRLVAKQCPLWSKAEPRPPEPKSEQPKPQPQKGGK